MDVVVERCCGLDVHKETVVACLLITEQGKRPRKELREFHTFTESIEELRDWLISERCQQVGMESTGVYWKPVYAVLEGSIELVVGNATHLRNVPGRKTDAKDAEWIAQLLRAGLIRKSYIPCKETRTLRKYVRHRRELIGLRVDIRNRIQKLLEASNIKLGCVVTDIFGKSGWAMLNALVENQLTPKQMSEMALGALRKKKGDIERAVQGRLEEDDRWILNSQMRLLERVEEDIRSVDAKIDECLSEYSELRSRLSQIPGVSANIASTILAEVGTNVDAFQTDKHLAKWAGVCPGNNESGGKQMTGKISKGNTYLKTALVEAAHAAVRTKGTFLKSKFYRLKARRGYSRAIMAIAHRILRSVWFMIKTGQDYEELGDNYLDQRDQQRLIRQSILRLESLGLEVKVTPVSTGS